MHHRSIKAHARALAKGEYSSVELTKSLLQRIENAHHLNAFITVTPDLALKQAAEADQRIRTENPGPLTGIPMVHKDIFCTRGIRTTCGSKMLSDFVSPYDATVVSRLANAGMVCMGKTNMDEFAMGSSNENSYYGVVRNPWDSDRVPGGSSGGSAAAVAARLSPVATATDTGGSIRQPAALCGITGIKPSYGRVSRYGMVAFASSLDQGGILATHAEDAALVLQAMAGFDERDSTSLDLPVPDYSQMLDEPLQGRVVGLPKEFFGDDVESDVADVIQTAVHELESLGARTVEVELPNCPVGVSCYYVLAPAEASSNLSRFDGVRYGHRAEYCEDLINLYERSRTEGFGDEVQRRIMTGTYVLSQGYYDAYYIKAQKLRRMISEDFARVFETCDLIAGPTSPGTAFPIGAKNDDPVAMYLNDIFTIPANLAGLPGISVHAGLDRRGLPVGLHLIGRYLDEATILNVAHQFQQATDWHNQIPGEYA